MKRDRHLSGRALATASASLLALAGVAFAASGDTVTGAASTTTTSVDQSLIVTLTDDGLGDGLDIAELDSMVIAFSRPLSGTFFPPVGLPISFTNASSVSIDSVAIGASLPNGWQGFLVVRPPTTTPTPLPYAVTLADGAASANDLYAGTVALTWTAAALDHFDLTVTGSTTPNVNVTTAITCRAEDAFGNLVSTYVGTPTVQLFQGDLTTPAKGTPSPASIAFAGGTATLNVADNYAEGPIAVRLLDTAPNPDVSGFADKTITWQPQPVQSYALSPNAVTAAQTVASLDVQNLTVSSGIATGDTVVLTLPGDWSLSGASAVGNHPASFTDGVVDVAARTVTWTATSFVAPGNIGSFRVDGSRATSFTQGQSASVRTTRDTALAVPFTVNAFGAQGLKAPLPPTGATANADTDVLLDIDSPSSTRRTYDNGQPCTYTFSFRTTTGLPANGTLELIFDNRASTFDLSTTVANGWSGVDGGFTATIDNTNKKVYLVRDGAGTATPGGTLMRVTLSDVGNPSAKASNYAITLQTRDAPFTGAQVGTNVLDSSGTNSPNLDPPASLFTPADFVLDFRPLVPDATTLSATGYPNLPKGGSITFTITDLDFYDMDNGDEFIIAFPPFGPDWSHLGGGFTITGAPSFTNFSAGSIQAMFGSSTPNAVVYTASGNDRSPPSSFTITVTLPNYELQGARVFFFHNSTDTGGDVGQDTAFSVTPRFNVVDTGNLVLNVPGGPARLTNDPGARIASAPTNSRVLYDVEFTHSVAIPTDGFVDVLSLTGDSHWTLGTGTGGMQARNLVVTGIRFGPDYRGAAGTGADDNKNTDNNGRVYLQLIRDAGNPANDVIQLRNDPGFGSGTLLAEGTVGTSNGLGFVTLQERNTSGVSGSVVIVTRGGANDVATANPPPVTPHAGFEPHSIRVDNGRSAFRFKNVSGSPIAAAGAKRFIVGDSTSDLVTVSTLPQSGTVTAQIIAANGTTGVEGPTSTPFTATGQAIEGPGALDAPTISLTQTRTYEDVVTATLRFATRSQIPPGGQVVLTLPAGFVIDQGAALAGSHTWVTNPRATNGAPLWTDPAGTGFSPAAFTVDGVGQTLVLTNGSAVPLAPGFHAVTLDSIVRNPPLPGSFVATVQTSGAGPLDPGGPTAASATNLAAVTIDGHTPGSGDAIVVNSVTQGVQTTGTTTTYTVQFVTESDIPVDGKVVIQFLDPTGTMSLAGILANGANTTWTSSNGAQTIGGYTVATTVGVNPMVTITRTSTGAVLTPGTMTIAFNAAMSNPRLGNRTFPVRVTTQTTGSATIDQSSGTAPPSFATTGGAVSGLTLASLSTSRAGATGANYQLTFNTQSRLPAENPADPAANGGRLVVTFPGNADASAAGVTVNSNPTGGAIVVAASGAANVLTIAYDGATDVPHGAWDITITNVRNATQAQPFTGASGIRVETRDNVTAGNVALDAPDDADVTYTGGDLTNVALSNPTGTPRPVVTANATSDTYTFDFRLNADVPSGNAIEVTFPLGFNVSNISTTPGTHITLQTDGDGVAPYSTTTNYTVSLLPDNLTVRLVATATIDAATTPFVRLSISNVRNTTSVATHTFQAIRTLNTGNGVTVDAWPGGSLPSIDVDGAGFAGGSVTYGVAPAAADQETSSHTMTFQMGSTLPRNGLVTITFEDGEVKLSNTLQGPNPGPASAFTGTAGDAITWAGIDGGYSIRAIERSTSAGVSRTGLVLERDPAGAGDTSPVRHAIQLVNVVTNTSVLGPTRYRIDAFRNPSTAMRPRLRVDGASGRLTLVSSALTAAEMFTSTDLTGALYLHVTGAAGNWTITAYRDVGRDVASQVGQVTGVLDTQAGVVLPVTDPVSAAVRNVVVDVAALAGGEVDVLESLWRIDPPAITAAGNEDRSGPATIVESTPQNVTDVVSPPAKGAASTHTVSFSTPVIVRTNHVIRVQLDKAAAQTSEFSFANVVGNPAANFTWTVNGSPVALASVSLQTDPTGPNPSVLWVQYTGAADLPSGNHVLTLRQVINSNDEGSDFFATVSMYRRIDSVPNPDVLAAGDRVLTETDSPNFSLSGAQLTNVTASPSENRAGRASQYTLRFRSLTQIPADGQVRIVFPKDALDLTETFGLGTLDGEVLDGTIVGVWRVDLDNNGSYETVLANATVELDAGDGTNSTLVLSRKDANGILGDGVTTVPHEIVFNDAAASEVVNVDTKGSYSLAISTHSYGGADTTPGAIIEGPNDSSPPFNIVGDTVTVTGVTLSPTASGAAGAQHTITFTTTTRLPNNARLVFTYDGGADTWANVTPAFNAGASTAGLNLINPSFSAGVLTFQRDGLGTTLDPGTYTVAVTGFTNSTNRHREHRVILETRDALNVPIDLAAAVVDAFPPKFIVQPGSLSSVSVTPSPTTAGNTNATHTINLTTTSAIPADGRLLVRYSDPGFSLVNVTSPNVTLSGVADPSKIQIETQTADGRIVIKLDGTLPSDLAPATRTLTIPGVINTTTAATNHTVSVVLVGGGATVAGTPEAFGALPANGVFALTAVNGQPPVVVPGTLTISTADTFIVDEVAGTITFPNGTAGGNVTAYLRYPELVRTAINSPVQVDLAATSTQFSITGGPATQIQFTNLGTATPRNRQSWPGTFSFQLLDAANNPTTQTGGQPIVVSFGGGETGAGATLLWSGVAGGGGTASIPASAISPGGVVDLSSMSFQGRLTGMDVPPGVNKATLLLSASIGGSPLTLVGAPGVDNAVKVIPGDFFQVAWPDTLAQQTVNRTFTGALVLQALDQDGNRPPTPTTTPDLQILPRSGPTTGGADETAVGAVFNLAGAGDVVTGANLDGSSGAFDLSAAGAKYIGPASLVFLHVHRVVGGAHVPIIDTFNSGVGDPATFLPRDPIQVTFVAGEAARVNWSLASAFGRRVSGPTPGTSLGAGTYNFTVALNGDTPAPTAALVLGAAITNDGPAIAAAVQTAIRNMTASMPALQAAYSQARVAFTGGRYVVVSGVSTAPSSVGAIVDTSGTAMDTLKLTDGQGASGTAGNAAAVYTIDSLFPGGAAFELQDAGGNPTTTVPDFLRLRLSSSSNPGFDSPRLSYEAATAATLPDVMVEPTPGVDYVDFLPPGTTTNLGNVLRYGGGNNNGLPMRAAVLLSREDTANSPRSVSTAAGTPLVVTQAAADWAPGDLVGKTVLFTSGPAFGRRAVITANTASTLTIAEPLAPLPRTLTGTMAVTNGSATVTGTGTLFTTELLPGHRVEFSDQLGVFYTVQSIGSDTSLTLTAPYGGAGIGNATAVRGGAPQAADTFQILTVTELPVVSSQVDGVDNTIVFTPAKASRLTLQGLTGTFRVDTANSGTVLAQDRYGNATNDVGGGAVFGLAASPPLNAAPFNTANIITGLPDGGGTTIAGTRFTNGVASIGPRYRGAASAAGTQQISLSVTVDGSPVTVTPATFFVDAGSPRHIAWTGLQSATLHAGRPLNDAAAPTGLGPAGAGPFEVRLYDIAGNAIEPSDIPTAPNGIQVDVRNDATFPVLDTNLADSSQPDAVTFGGGTNVLQAGAFAGNVANIANMRFEGRASQINGHQLLASLLEPGNVLTALIPVSFAPAQNPATNPSFTVKPGALVHFHWFLSNTLVQQPSQALDPGGTYEVHAHDAYHNRLGATGEAYENRPNTPLAGAGFDLAANPGTTPELVYLFPQNAGDPNARVNFGGVDPGSAAPLLGRVRLDKAAVAPSPVWSGGVFRLGPSPQADLRYFGLNGDVRINVDVNRVTPGRRIGQLTGTMTISGATPTVVDGTGTSFTTEVQVGERLEFSNDLGTYYEVASIVNATQLILATNGPNGNNLTATPFLPILANVTNASNPAPPTSTDFIRIGAGDVDHFWFKDASASDRWDEAQVNNVAWNAVSPGVQIVARDIAGNPINTYTTDGEDVRLITYEHHTQGTASAYNGATFQLTFSAVISASATPDNVILVNRRTGAVAKVTGIAGATISLEAPGFRFGAAGDDTIVLNTDVLDVLVRLNPATWRFTVGDTNINTNRDGGASNDQPQILKTQFDFAGGTFSINDTLGGAANGLKWTGRIPTSGTIIVRPVINVGLGQFEHRGIRTGELAPAVPTSGGLELPVGPGAVTDFVWSTAATQQNAVAFSGTNTLTAVDVSGNVNTTFNGTTDLTVQVAPASRTPPVGTGLVSGPGASTSTQLASAEPSLSSVIVGRTLHLTDGGGVFKADAVVVAFDDATDTITTTSIFPVQYAAGDLFVIDPFPAGATPTLTPNQITGLNWTNGVANLSAGALDLTYQGVAAATGGVQTAITLTATSGPVSETSSPIIMTPGPGAKLAVLFRGTGLGAPDELLVEGAPSGAGGNPTIVQQLTPSVTPTQALFARVVVLDQNNNRLAAPGASTAAVRNSDPFGAQGPTAATWDANGRVEFSVSGRTVNNLVAPPATRNTPAAWTLAATSTGGFATPAGVADRNYVVVTDGVKRVEYLLDHAAAASGTFGASDAFTATSLTIAAAPFTSDMLGMVLVNDTNAGAFARITGVSATTLTFTALQGADPTRVGAVWQAGDQWRVLPMYHVDGMISSTAGSPGVEGTVNTRLLTAGTGASGRVLLLDSGNNITAGAPTDTVTVTTTDPFDVHPSGLFNNGVFSFTLTPRQAAHNVAGLPTTRDETDSFTITNHQVSISPTVTTPGVTAQGASNYRAVPGAAAGVVLLISPPSQKLRRGDALTPVSGDPPLQTAGTAFLTRAYVVDQDTNPVAFTGNITFAMPFAAAAGPFAITGGDTGNLSFVTINRFGTGLVITPNDPGIAGGPSFLRATTPFDVRPAAPAHAIVYVSAATSGGGVETLTLGQSAAGNPPASLSLAGALTETAGLDNLTITATLTDAFSNPVLTHEFLAPGDDTVRVTTTDPNNPAFDFNLVTGSTTTFTPTYDYAGFPPAGTGIALAATQRTITITRAQLQHLLLVDPASVADDVAVAITNHPSRGIRVNPQAASQAVILLPGQSLNTGAKTGQPVFIGTPDDQVEGVEFPVGVFSVDAFYNVQFGDSTSTLSTIVTDEGTSYVGGLGFRLSAENASTLINNGQLEFTSLNGLTISPQLPFANGSTGPEVADEIQQAVREQTIAVSEATTRFQAFFLAPFARYLLVSGQASKGVGPTSEVVMGGNTSPGLNLLALGSAGATGTYSPASASFTSGVLAFSMRHAVAADIHFIDATLTVGGSPVTARSENYRVLKPDFAVASVTLLDDGQGKVDRARIVFTLSSDPNSTAGAAQQFELTQTIAGKATSLRGASVSLLSTVAPNDTIDVFFNGKLSTTDVEGMTLTYTRPQSGGLRADPDSGGKLLDTTTRTTVGGLTEILDGASPALVNVTRADVDGNGGLDLVRFVFSEDVAFSSGAGFSRSVYDAGDVTTTAGADDTFLIDVDGDGAQPVVLGDQQTGSAIAELIQASVRGMTAADPLKQRAFDNFTATYDTRSGRYLLRSGVGLSHDGARYLVDWGASAVVVTPQVGNTGAANLGLGAGVGIERVGFGDAQPGMSVSAVAPLMEVIAGTTDQLRIQLSGDAPRLISLSVTVESTGTPSLDDRGAAIADRLQQVVRSVITQSPSLQPAYDGFTATWDPVRDQLVLVSGTVGDASTVVILPTGTPQDVAPDLGLGLANGGVELVGNDATPSGTRPIEDLVVLSQDGLLNLLAGRTDVDVTVSGNRIDVNLSNAPGTGTAMPRFAWIDAGDGGFIRDRNPAPRSLPESTNMSDLDGRFAVVIEPDGTNDDILKVAPGDVLLDGSQSLPPLTPAGGRVLYRWEQVGVTDPAVLAIDNGDGNPPGQVTADSSSPTARILGAVAPGDYNLRLVITIVDQNGVPVPNAFTDGAGQVVREFRVQVTDDPPVALITGPDPLVTEGPVTVDGSQSLDPNGGAVTYLWTAETVNGTAVVGAFSDPTAPTPTFSAPSDGVYKVTLYVATSPALPVIGSSPSDSIYVIDGAGSVPYAEPGPHLTGRVRIPVTMEGALSVPVQGAAYDWTVLSTPVPVQLALSGSRATFTPSSPGLYRFQLSVSDTDTGLTSAPREVSVMVVDDLANSPRFPPVARPRVVGLRRAAFLDQAPSTPPSRVVLDSGQEVAINQYVPAGQPTPAVAGLTPFDLIAGGTVEATAYVHLPSGRELRTLRLNDGTAVDILGFAWSGDQLTLDGTQSQSATSVVSDYTWRQLAGPFSFSTRSGGILGLPVVTGLYRLELTVADSAGLTSRPVELEIAVLPLGATGQGPPTATATAPARVALGGDADLDATDSVSRASTSALTYRWEQLAGPACGLSQATSATATASPTATGVYTFRVTVTDANGVSDTAEVTFAADGDTAEAPVARLSGPSSLALAPGVTRVSASLSASATPSPGTGAHRFLWSQLDGSPVFVDTTAADTQPRVELRAAGRYTFAVRAVVVDAAGLPLAVSAPATTSFFVTGGDDVALVNGASRSESSGGCAMTTGASRSSSGWALGALAVLLLVVRLATRTAARRGVA